MLLTPDIITPQGVFISLYQPNGINIFGELIEGTGHSINPRYYGAFAQVAKQVRGNAPEFNNIYEYSPSVLEVAFTAVRDPIFYQLYSKILEFFHYYQEALPAYQFNDVVVPGVKIENVDVSELYTYFSDYEIDVSNVIPQLVGHHNQQDHRPYPTVMAHVTQPNCLGPKYDYDGVPININAHRHFFYELNQFVYDCKLTLAIMNLTLN